MDKIKLLLALDQSTKKTGFCIVKNGVYHNSGVLTVCEEKQAFERMKTMNEKISKLISEVKPDYVVFEQIQFQKNYSTYRQLAQLQGIIMAYLFNHDIPFTIIESTAWKSFIGIKSKHREEQKKDTQKFVSDKYGINVTDDEADSIGIAEWSIKNIIGKDK